LRIPLAGHESGNRKERLAVTIEDNKQLVLRWKEEIWVNQNLNIIDELFSPDYVGRIAGVPGPLQGRDALKPVMAAYLAAFDIDDTPEFLIAENDMVAIHDTYTLRHKGEFQGIPATGKEGSVTGTDIYRIVDGKIVEQWVEAELLGLMQEFGIFPNPGLAER
jgi:predicted ester cyclase